MDQDEFCKKMEPHPVDAGRHDEADLTKEEKTGFRSVLGAMLWICIVRISLIADTVLAQGEIDGPKIKHLRAVNAVVERATGRQNQPWHAGELLLFHKVLHACDLT